MPSVTIINFIPVYKYAIICVIIHSFWLFQFILQMKYLYLIHFYAVLWLWPSHKIAIEHKSVSMNFYEGFNLLSEFLPNIFINLPSITLSFLTYEGWQKGILCYFTINVKFNLLWLLLLSFVLLSLILWICLHSPGYVFSFNVYYVLWLKRFLTLMEHNLAYTFLLPSPWPVLLCRWKLSGFP